MKDTIIAMIDTIDNEALLMKILDFISAWLER